MELTLYTADCRGVESNTCYPNKVVVDNAADFSAAIAHDHVIAEYKGNHRSNDDFIKTSCMFLDVDNNDTDDPSQFITPEKLNSMFEDYDHIITPSRHNMLQKGSYSARPRMHIYFLCRKEYTSFEEYKALKTRLQDKYPFFDRKAIDAARFFYGVEVKPEDVIWNEGFLKIEDVLDEPVSDEEAFVNYDNSTDTNAPLYDGGPIKEGSRNSTLSHQAGIYLKRFGDTDKAHQLYLNVASNCDPPLSDDEINTIWHSAQKFYKKVKASPGYIPPDKYDDEFGVAKLKPEDYSDIGEAKVLTMVCMDKLCYTSGTDFLAYEGDYWHEDRQKALGVVEDFMDLQLTDANAAIETAEEALIALGIPKEMVKARDKSLANQVPEKKIGLLYALIGADTYKKFVMKYRNFKNLTNAQNTAKPMLAIDVAALDFDATLLNTPDATYDLTKGMAGGRPHNPDDLITKMTACSPGDKGEDLWSDALKLFFCNDDDLIMYVKQIVGMAAVGRVYAEQMIIAYGGGANGKSTFWNTIARVLGTYSGKISAEVLTMNVKRNTKPEMAELKGMRLTIASELEEGTRLNTGMVKQLCSVDKIEAEKKYKDPFSFEPSHTLVLYTNHLPRVTANDDGTWRRLIVIPFNAKITGTSDIKNYSDYLYENAGPSILKWVIEGAEEAIKKGFKIPEPKAVIDAVEKYREDNDWLGHFIDDHCDVDPSYKEKSGELYQTYRNVCIQNGEYVRSTSDFYGNLEKVGFIKKKTNEGRFIVGLRLKVGQDFLE